MRFVHLVLAAVLAAALVAPLAGCPDKEAAARRQADAQKSFMEAEAKARAAQEAAEAKQALDDATARCTGGAAEGCIALGRIHEREARAADALAAFGKACTLKSKDGCRMAAAATSDEKARLGFLTALCDLEDVESCVQGAALADTLVEKGVLPEPKSAKDREALVLLARACELKAAIACTARGVALANDDPKAAVASFGKGCDAGEPTSCDQLANMWATGKGVKKKDAKKAKAFKKKACDAGLQEACG